MASQTKWRRRLQMLERRVEQLVARQILPPNNLSPSESLYVNSPARMPTTHSSSPADSASNLSTDASRGTVTSALCTPPGSIDRSSPVGISTIEVHLGDIIDRGLVTLQSAELALDRFRHNAAKHFPFVILPVDAPTESVRRANPYLFLAIVAAMSFHQPDLQYQLGEEARTQFIQRLFFNGDRTLDLLQGLLVYTTWYSYFNRREKQDVFLLAQLCVTLTQELSLDKTGNRQDNSSMSGSRGDPMSLLLSKNAQKRAYLGTYYLSCSCVTLHG
jgi:hypothetical protein